MGGLERERERRKCRTCNLTVLLYTCVCNCHVSMSHVLYVRLPLILAAKLVGLFFTIALKKKKKKKELK